ncbi:MAG: PQQ-binding-like beta-propeller repeat protein [Gemmatimonadaceae bacterium]|nr:PQQ-binding-like beta-propeller repeat protein [Gemmatimonadaceae bacterium]
MRLGRRLSVYAVAAALGIAAACGEPTTTVTPTPTVQTPKLLWTTVIAGGGIAADASGVYLSANSGGITVLSRTTGVPERTLTQVGTGGNDDLRLVGNALLFSGFETRLTDIATGGTRWNNALTRSGTPMLLNDSLAFIVGNATPRVHAIRLGDGTTKWTADASPDDFLVTPSTFVLITGSAVNESVVVATYAVTNAFSSVQQSGMAAFDAQTGARKWTVRLTDPDIRLGQPAIAGGMAVATTGAGVSYGVNIATGQRIWTAASVSVLSSPALFGGQTYATNGLAVASDGLIGRSALDPLTGQRLWQAADLAVNSSVAWAMVLPNGQLMATNRFGHLVGIEVSRTPRVVWSYPLSVIETPVAGTALGDTVFITTRQRVHAFVVPR